MATVYDLKPRFQDLLRPVARWLAGRGVAANQVTLGALGLSCAAGAAIALAPDRAWPLLVLPFVLLVRMALNAIDGMLAREHDQQTHLGAVLNELGDVASDAALYLPFALVPAMPSALVVLVVFAGILVEMTGVIAIQIGASRRYDGPLGKSDRAVLFGMLGLLLGLGIAPGLWTNLLLGLALLLSLLTIVRRARMALAERAL